MSSDDLRSRHIEHGESITELMRGIFRDAHTLWIKEFAAAKLDVREEISNAVRSSIFLGVGLFSLATGVVVLSIVLALLLARYFALPVWASLAIVGVAYTVLGLVHYSWPTLGVFALLGWFVGRSLKSKSASKQSSIDHRSNTLASRVALGAANVVGVVTGELVRDFVKDRRKRRSP
jgi:hypothetical protein